MCVVAQNNLNALKIYWIANISNIRLYGTWVNLPFTATRCECRCNFIPASKLRATYIISIRWTQCQRFNLIFRSGGLAALLVLLMSLFIIDSIQWYNPIYQLTHNSMLIYAIVIKCIGNSSNTMLNLRLTTKPIWIERMPPQTHKKPHHFEWKKKRELWSEKICVKSRETPSRGSNKIK